MPVQAQMKAHGISSPVRATLLNNLLSREPPQTSSRAKALWPALFLASSTRLVPARHHRPRMPLRARAWALARARMPAACDRVQALKASSPILSRFEGRSEWMDIVSERAREK
eukprot:CAMPEP_0175227162 /NCGR_PEP_ID=MMETSP0093-20121207/23265_1 /TAXON_ID=311494 /ORGANISM="Alexandrium monilatum, Strain CCMP3105" /LENGTH=112 /DNA_ID=CAMNT_0016520907 /DNA_START=22 /DNA_END=358 /DNA_ORIENTATION=-